MPERYLYTQDIFTIVSGSNYYTWSATLSQEIGKANNTLLKILIAIYQYDNDRVQLITVIMFPHFPAPIEVKSHFFKLLTAYLINLRQLSCAWKVTNSS